MGISGLGISFNMNDKEIMLNNLSLICLDPEGKLGNANSWKKLTYKSDVDYYYSPNKGSSSVKINGEEIDLDQLEGEDFQEIKQALINEIKTNPSEWKVIKEGKLEVVINKFGRKHWNWTYLSNSEIKELLKNSSFQSNSEQQNQSEWLKKGGWGAVIIIGVLVIGFIVYKLFG